MFRDLTEQYWKQGYSEHIKNGIKIYVTRGKVIDKMIPFCFKIIRVLNYEIIEIYVNWDKVSDKKY